MTCKSNKYGTRGDLARFSSQPAQALLHRWFRLFLARVEGGRNDFFQFFEATREREATLPGQRRKIRRRPGGVDAHPENRGRREWPAELAWRFEFRSLVQGPAWPPTTMRHASRPFPAEGSRRPGRGQSD